jgi:hypothetical protein
MLGRARNEIGIAAFITIEIVIDYAIELVIGASLSRHQAGSRVARRQRKGS